MLSHFCPFPSPGYREVQKAVNTAQGLFQRWTELLQDPSTATREEIDWTTNELRNNLRSIEWDLEDLDETINILFWGICATWGKQTKGQVFIQMSQTRRWDTCIIDWCSSYLYLGTLTVVAQEAEVEWSMLLPCRKILQHRGHTVQRLWAWAL